MTMNSSRSLTTQFSANLTSNTLTPEWWLDRYYPGTGDFENAAMSDTDRDGMLVWEEAIAGTIPTNSNSVLVLTLDGALGGMGDGFVLTWQSFSGSELAQNYFSGASLDGCSCPRRQKRVNEY